MSLIRGLVQALNRKPSTLHLRRSMNPCNAVHETRFGAIARRDFFDFEGL